MSSQKTRTFPSGFSDRIAAFDAAQVDYMIVGGYAVAAHGRPRATKDLDLFVAGGENLARVAAALGAFGMPPALVEAARRLGDEEVLFFGVPPARVDLLRSISGLSFDDARAGRVRMRLGARGDVPVIGLADLITNKRASGRAQDLADVTALERLAKTPKRRRRA